MPDLAVLIPTRGRPGNIRKVIGAWDFTNAWDDADMVLIVDQDDPQIGGYRDLLDEFLEGCPENTPSPLKLVEMPVWMPMVHKLDAVAASVAADGEYFALGFAGDDHLPQTIWWAKIYLAKLRELGTGMVYGDDGYQGKKLSTEWAVTADAVHVLGRMVPAPVEHLYCDNSIMELFAAAGMLKHLPQVRVEHVHPAAGKAPTDEQYQRVNASTQYASDGRIYQGWKKTQMLADVAKLKALKVARPGHPVPGKDKRMGSNPFPKPFKQVKGLTPLDVEIALADLAVGVQADQEIVELGTYHGRTALILAWGAQQGNGAHVTTIDPWDLARSIYGTELGDLAGARAWARYWVRGLGYSNRINLVHEFSDAAAAGWSGSPIGLLLLHGKHVQRGVQHDLTAWAGHLAPGARIVISDYMSEDRPEVRRAIDDLVNEGFLKPIEVYHDQMAVTGPAGKDGGKSPAARPVTAITSAGVSPSPMVARTEDLDPAVLAAEWEKVDPEGVAALRESAAKLPDSGVSRLVVGPDEIFDVPGGTPIGELNLVKLKALAKTRGIVLGARKDKRAEILQALEAGR